VYFGSTVAKFVVLFFRIKDVVQFEAALKLEIKVWVINKR